MFSVTLLTGGGTGGGGTGRKDKRLLLCRVNVALEPQAEELEEPGSLSFTVAFVRAD